MIKNQNKIICQVQAHIRLCVSGKEKRLLKRTKATTSNLFRKLHRLESTIVEYLINKYTFAIILIHS